MTAGKKVTPVGKLRDWPTSPEETFQEMSEASRSTVTVTISPGCITPRDGLKLLPVEILVGQYFSSNQSNLPSSLMLHPLGLFPIQPLGE